MDRSPSGKRSFSRRTYLTIGVTTLATSLAGCASITDDPNPTEGESQQQNTETQTTREKRIALFEGDENNFNIENLNTDEGADNTAERTNTYAYWDLFNSGHPDTTAFDISVTNSKITATLKQAAVFKELTFTARIRLRRDGDWQPLDQTTTLEPNNEPRTDPSYQPETIEFDLPIDRDPHIPLSVTISVEGGIESKRLLKTIQSVEIPYETTDGQDTKTLEDHRINYRTINGDETDPTHVNNAFVETNNDGSRTVFSFIDPWEGNPYGVSTTISATAIEEQDISTEDWGSLIDKTRHAEDWDHIQTLSSQIQTAQQTLGNWNTLQQKLRSFGDYIGALPYERRVPIQDHPTAGLLRAGVTNCTGKTLLFNALLQADPLAMSGDEAGYLWGYYQGNGHIVGCIAADQFEEIPEDWQTYTFLDKTAEETEAPGEKKYIGLELTSDQTDLGVLPPEDYKEMRVIENIDAEYVRGE